MRHETTTDRTSVLALAALGVVYGDIGTSPLYALKEVFGKSATHKTHGVTDPQDRLTLRAEIDALVARLYDLTIEEFQHILSTFPLVDESVKSQTLNTYRDLLKLGKLPDLRQ